MKRKVTAAVGGLAVVGAAVAISAGTYSYFTDTEGSGTQSVGTGTLNLEVGGTAVSEPFAAKNVAPGWSESKTFSIENTGSLPGKLRVSVSNTGDAELREATDLTISGPGISPTTVPLSALNASGYVLPSPYELPAGGGPYTFDVTLSIPAEEGNAIQGQNAQFKATFDLLQETAPDDTEAVTADN
jgi:predicted ribosomally synthesized peptide with SipW-like signal peptide